MCALNIHAGLKAQYCIEILSVVHLITTPETSMCTGSIGGIIRLEIVEDNLNTHMQSTKRVLWRSIRLKNEYIL